ncbi:Gamma-tubulin complex component 3 [Thelohanellus kitauei]|uniref:Gamma-tubulin complex component 3 n=1 Tax=Thelohanellus kitauei TaxID=669202 RepID=A0A0C2MVL3_THEKT|nr:Gamma-tubulin complex component 3 [Thelohanellus kitauei]
MNNMTSILESAINSSNAQFDSKDILQRLDCKIAQSSPGDLGWDVFTLHYHTRGPLQVIVDARNVGKLIRYINLVKYEIHHFISQLEYFLTFEVLECSKAQFIDSLKKASDLDGIIRAHDHFVNNIISSCFLNEESEVRVFLTKVIQFKLHEVFKKVLQFESIYRNAIATISTEINHLQAMQSNDTSKYESIIKYTLNKISSLSISYRRLMVDFLRSLMESSNTQHYYLAFRLDFNEYYTKTIPQDVNM